MSGKKNGYITSLDNLELKNYRMNINNNGEEFPVSVIHVTNWEDFTTINADTLKKLVSTVNQKIEDKLQQESNCCNQAFIHCSAGAGRTGVLTAAMQLMKPGNPLSAKEIVSDLRKSGCRQMVQKETQYQTLLELEAQQKTPSSEPVVNAFFSRT